MKVPLPDQEDDVLLDPGGDICLDQEEGDQKIIFSSIEKKVVLSTETRVVLPSRGKLVSIKKSILCLMETRIS